MAEFEVHVDTSRIRLRLGAMPEAVRGELLDVMQVLDEALVGDAEDHAPDKTGNLRAHIKGAVRASARRITASATARAKYAAILEWGGTIAAHDILPKSKEVEKFLIGGAETFAKVVHHPASKMPRLYYMHAALDDLESEIIAGMESAVARGVAA